MSDLICIGGGNDGKLSSGYNGHGDHWVCYHRKSIVVTDQSSAEIEAADVRGDLDHYIRETIRCGIRAVAPLMSEHRTVSFFRSAQITLCEALVLLLANYMPAPVLEERDYQRDLKICRGKG